MERAQTEKAETDVLMQIPVAAEGRFAVVQVERAEVFQPDYLLEIVQRLFEGGRCPQIVSRGVDVAGIEADADPFLVIHEGDDVPQVFKRGADDVAAARHGFEDGRDASGGCVGAVESFGYAGDGGGAGVAACPARVEVVESDAKGFAAAEVVEEGVVGLGSFSSVFLGEVDEIGAVGEDMATYNDELRWMGLICGWGEFPYLVASYLCTSHNVLNRSR